MPRGTGLWSRCVVLPSAPVVSPPPLHRQEGIGLYQSSKIVVKETLLHLLLTWLFSQINVVVAAG